MVLGRHDLEPFRFVQKKNPILNELINRLSVKSDLPTFFSSLPTFFSSFFHFFYDISHPNQSACQRTVSLKVNA